MYETIKSVSFHVRIMCQGSNLGKHECFSSYCSAGAAPADLSCLKRAVLLIPSYFVALKPSSTSSHLGFCSSKALTSTPVCAKSRTDVLSLQATATKFTSGKENLKRSFLVLAIVAWIGLIKGCLPPSYQKTYIL